MKNLLIILFLINFLCGCYKEQSTHYYAYLTNNTQHTIEIKPYFQGNTFPSLSITLNPNQTIEIANGVQRGKNPNGGFNSKYISGSDSIRVSFDIQHTITHYVNTPANLNFKYYLFTSLRNIAYARSYTLEGKDIGKNGRENKYTYTFTEQDYLDAK